MMQPQTLTLPTRRDPLARTALFVLIGLVAAINILQPRWMPVVESAQAQAFATAMPGIAENPAFGLAMPTPTVPPAPTDAPAQPHLVTAYAAPLGAILGPLDLNEGVQPVGRYGDGWIQLQRADSSRVWVAAGDAPDLLTLAMQQPDAQPPPYVAPLALANTDPDQEADPITPDTSAALAADAALYSTLPTAGPMPDAPARHVCTEAQLHAPRGANCALPQSPSRNDDPSQAGQP